MKSQSRVTDTLKSSECYGLLFPSMPHLVHHFENETEVKKGCPYLPVSRTGVRERHHSLPTTSSHWRQNTKLTGSLGLSLGDGSIRDVTRSTNINKYVKK